MPNDLFPQTTPELAAHRKPLAPDIHDAFTHFSERVFAAGALPIKFKQLIAVAVAHLTQCPNCIHGHTSAALRHGGDGARDHGSHLGRGRNARRWSLCPLGDRARYD
jgi:AhpD family alkylhydroperoxidase